MVWRILNLGDILEEGLRDYPTFVEKRILIHGK
jgi:hypothetical protein